MFRDFGLLTEADNLALLREWVQETARRTAWRSTFFAGEPDFPTLTQWLQDHAKSDQWERIARVAPAGRPPWAEPSEVTDLSTLGKLWACDLVASAFGERLIKRDVRRVWGVIGSDVDAPDDAGRWGVLSPLRRGHVDVLPIAYAAVDFASWVRRETLEPAFTIWDGHLIGVDKDPVALDGENSLEWARQGRHGDWQIGVPTEAAHLEPERVARLVDFLSSRKEVTEVGQDDRDRLNLRVEPGGVRQLKKDAQAWWDAQAQEAL